MNGTSCSACAFFCQKVHTSSPVPSQPLSPLISCPGSPRSPTSEPMVNCMAGVSGFNATWPAARRLSCQLGANPQAAETKPPRAVACPGAMPAWASSSIWAEGLRAPIPCRAYTLPLQPTEELRPLPLSPSRR